MRTIGLLFLLLVTASATTAQVTGDTSVCAGDNVTYYVPTITGASYSWSITGGSINGASNTDSCIIQWGNPGTGTIIVTVNPPNGGPIYHTLNVAIHPKPQPVITHAPYPTCPADSSNGTGQPDHKDDCEKVCKFATITYCTPFNAGSSYQWTVVGALAVTGATTNCATVTWDSTLVGLLVVVETNQWGCVDSAELCVEKVDLPKASFTSLSNVCKFTSTLFTNTSTGATSYFWDFGDGNTTTINSNPGHATHSYSNPGTYTITLIAFNDCHCSDTFQRTITVDSFPGPQITCIETVCAFDTATYCTPAVTGCNYNWFVNGGTIISGSGTPCITVAWGAGQLGTIGLQLTGCGAVCNDTSFVYIPIVPTVGVINGPNKVCPGECHTYSLPHFSGATYNWTLSSSCGSVISDSTNCEQIEICFSPFATNCNDTLTVTFWDAFLNCGGSAQLIIRIRPELTIFGNSPACSNQLSPFFASGGQPVFWSISPAGPILSGSPAPSVTINWNGMTGNFILTAVPLNPNAFCNDSTFKLIKVIAAPPPPVITGDTIVCANSSVQYCATGTHTINWLITGGTPTSATGNCVTVTWGTSGPFIVRAYQQLATSPFCPSDEDTLNVQVVTTVAPPVLNGPANACANGTSTFFTTSTYPSGATFSWSLSPSNAGTITSGQGTTSINIEWGNNAPQVVTVTLTVTVCGQTKSTNISVTLNPAPATTVSQIGQLCPGGSAQLSATGTGTFAWSGPSGFTGTGNPVPIFIAGLYSVTVTNTNGCTSTSQYNVQYVSGPTASISTADATTYCIGQSFSVAMCALGNANYTYLWSTGATTQCITVSLPGSYNVTVTDITNGCTAISNTITISVITCQPGGTPCVPNGSVSFTQNACNPFTFTNTSVNAFDFFWSFGDGFNSTATNPTHTYSNAGFYMVTLCGKVPNPTNTDTCQLYDTTQLVVPLAAKFDVNIGCNGTPVCFTDKSTTTAGTTITSWFWNFGDANSSFLQNPCHIYAAPGTYVVTLTITGTGTGCTSTFTDTITVPPPPTAAFTFTSPCCVGQAVLFTDASAPNIKTWNWDFGDGGTSLNQNPTHSYALAGTYTVTLIVCDSMGCCDTTAQTKLVNAPSASGNIIALPDTVVCAGTAVTLVAPTCGGCTYLWSNGSTNDSIVVTSTGIYVVTITDAGGCKYSTFIKIIVNPNPPTTITNSGKDELCLGEFTSLCVPYHVNFTWFWISNDPGVNGSTANCAYVSPTSTGTYTYQVIVTDTSTGCLDTSQVYTIVVHPLPVPPIITALGSTTVCQGDTVILVGSHPDTTVTMLWSTGDINDTLIVTEDGCYTLTVTDTNGCKNQATLCVTVNPLPDLCMFYEGCLDTCLPYTILGPPGTSWQWLLNGNIISGATQQNYTATLNGAYSVIVTNSFGCFDTTGVLNLTMHPCDTACADFVIDSVVCDEAGNYILYYHLVNYSGYMVTEFSLQVLPPDTGLLFAPSLVIDSIPYGGTSPTYTATIFNGNVGDTICFRTRVVAVDSMGVEVLCCLSDTECVVLPPCDTSCCYFRYLGDTIVCEEGPAGMEYHFTLFVDGCGELTITQAGGQGTLTGINNPYSINGFTQISGTYITSVDSFLCLTFVLTDGAVICADTTICIRLRCPSDSLECDWEFDDHICAGQCTSFMYTGPTGGVTVTWGWPGGLPPSATGPGPHTVCYASPGTYFVNMTLSSANQTLTCRDTVFVTAPPVASITQTGNTLYAFPAGMTYQWTSGPPNYTPISGQTNQFYSPPVGDLYCVIVTNQAGCSDTACRDFTPVDGIASIDVGSWNIYPNPNDGAFTITLEVAQSGELEFRLLNALGEVVDLRRWVMPAGQRSLSFSEDLAAGVYIVQLRTQSGTVQRRMVVE